jgi:hypothetical protein
MERGFSEFVVERRRAHKALKVNQRNLKHARLKLAACQKRLEGTIQRSKDYPDLPLTDILKARAGEVNRLTKAVVDLEDGVRRCREVVEA